MERESLLSLIAKLIDVYERDNFFNEDVLDLNMIFGKDKDKYVWNGEKLEISKADLVKEI